MDRFRHAVELTPVVVVWYGHYFSIEEWRALSVAEAVALREEALS